MSHIKSTGLSDTGNNSRTKSLFHPGQRTLRDYTAKRVIVSLTSFPAAIKYAAEAVKTILNGNLLPDKIVLYLVFEQFGEEGIPQYILDMVKEYPVFEVRNYDRDLRSYLKLIPALKDFPEDIIVTIDDDINYHPNMLRSLLNVHKEIPEEVIAHRAKLVSLTQPYKQWKKFRWYHFIGKRFFYSPWVLQTGVGGVLYPPHALKEEMLDEDLFTSLAPTTDDLWFWAATVANGRSVVCVPFGPYNKPQDLDKPLEISLKNVNFKNGTHKNDISFKNILEHYPSLVNILEKQPLKAGRFGKL